MTRQKNHKVKFLPSGITALLFFLLLTACAPTSGLGTHEEDSSTGPNGFLEFYCVRCMTGYAIFRMENGKTIRLGERLLGRKVQETVRSPTRLKTLRIPHEVGSFEFEIRLLPVALVDRVVDVIGSSSRRIHIIIAEDNLTPVRLEFVQKTHRTLEWDLKEGRRIPLKASPENLEVLTSALNTPNWETRWYAAKVLGELEVDIPDSALNRLEELSSKDAYKQCLGAGTVEECSLLQRQAADTMKKIKKANP